MLKAVFLAFALSATAATCGMAGTTAYLRSTGSGTTCSLASPCSSMTSAKNVAGAGGEVICLDKGNYGGADFRAAITISCGDALWEAPSAFVNVDMPAGTDVVIEGLVLDNLAVVSGGSIMQFIGPGSLHLHRVRIGNKNVSSDTHGLLVAPERGATLHVSDSVFYNNGGSGIHVRPTDSGYVNVHMRNVKFERNGNGLFIDGSASTVGVNADVTASVFAENSGNGIGAFATAGKAGITVSVKDAQITGNLGNGIGVLASSASGAGSATVEVGSSMISGNVNGVSASSAGQIRTFGNNQVRFNGINGAFTGSVGLQ